MNRLNLLFQRETLIKLLMIILIPSFCLSQDLPKNIKSAYSINREKKVVEVPYDEMGRIGAIVNNYQSILKYNKSLVSMNDSLRHSLFLYAKADSLCYSSNERNEQRIKNLIIISDNSESKVAFMEQENRNMVKERKDIETRYFLEVDKKKGWKTATIIGIPVGFIAGVIVKSLIKK